MNLLQTVSYNVDELWRNNEGRLDGQGRSLVLTISQCHCCRKSLFLC